MKFTNNISVETVESGCISEAAPLRPNLIQNFTYRDAVYGEFCLASKVFSLEYQSSGVLFSGHEVQLKKFTE